MSACLSTLHWWAVEGMVSYLLRTTRQQDGKPVWRWRLASGTSGIGYSHPWVLSNCCTSILGDFPLPLRSLMTCWCPLRLKREEYNWIWFCEKHNLVRNRKHCTSQERFTFFTHSVWYLFKWVAWHFILKQILCYDLDFLMNMDSNTNESVLVCVIDLYSTDEFD